VRSDRHRDITQCRSAPGRERGRCARRADDGRTPGPGLGFSRLLVPAGSRQQNAMESCPSRSAVGLRVQGQRSSRASNWRSPRVRIPMPGGGTSPALSRAGRRVNSSWVAVCVWSLELCEFSA